MKHSFLAALLSAGLLLPASPVWAQRGGGGHGGGGHAARGGHAMGSGASRGFGSGRATAGSRRSGPWVGHAVLRDGAGSGRGYGPNHGYGRYGLYGPALGFGFGLGLGFYDPFWGDGGYEYGSPEYAYPGYGYAIPYVVPPDVMTGGLRIEVKPDTAAVYVDGYYAGIIDDFDGHFQHLDLPPGQHQIEVRAPGYATLTFDTIIQAHETTDFKGNLVPANAPDR